MKVDDSEAIIRITIKNQLCDIEIEGFGAALQIAEGMENNLASWMAIVEEFMKQKSTMQ